MKVNKNHVEKVCTECGKTFITITAIQVTCSPECSASRHRKHNKKYNKARAVMKQKNCVVCGEKFETTHPSKLTCSKECSDAYHKEQVKAWHKNKNKNKTKTGKANTNPETKTKQSTKSNGEALAEEARKAKELGMSYGMYKAMKLMEGECYE